MKTSTKALLFSALVVPGAGHIILKKKFSAFCFLTATCLATFFLILKLLQVTSSVIEKLWAQGKMNLDPLHLHGLVTESLAKEGGSLTTVIYILVLLWLVALIDIYRLTKGASD